MREIKGPLGFWGFPLLSSILGSEKRVKSKQTSKLGGKSAVALSEDKTTISPRFARCSYFRVDGRIIENPYKDAPSAVGPEAVEYLASLGVQRIKAGGFGGNATAKARELGVVLEVV